VGGGGGGGGGGGLEEEAEANMRIFSLHLRIPELSSFCEPGPGSKTLARTKSKVLRHKMKS